MDEVSYLIEIKQQEIERIMTELKKYDEYTYEHSMRVAELSFAIGKQLNLSEDECNEIYLAGLLHDIGKLEIPIEIITKKSKLSNEEYEMIKEHPMRGYNIMRKCDVSKSVLNSILGHHERLNGSGYPHRLKDSEISLFSKILGVVDSFDAMTSDRTYSKGMTDKKALKYLLKDNGEMYDKNIVKSLISCCERRN